jgi:hypothetical protein
MLYSEEDMSVKFIQYDQHQNACHLSRPSVVVYKWSVRKRVTDSASKSKHMWYTATTN